MIVFWTVLGIVGPVGIGLWTWYVGIKADNKHHIEALEADERSRKAEIEAAGLRDQEHRQRLVISMLTEITTFHNFIRTTAQPFEGWNYVLEASSIFETVGEQVRLLKQSELIQKLSEYRTYLTRMKAAFDILNKATPGINNQHVSHVRGNWNSWWNEGKNLNTEVRNLLVREFDGDLPKEFQEWSKN